VDDSKGSLELQLLSDEIPFTNQKHNSWLHNIYERLM